MNIRVNGENITVDEGKTLIELIQQYKLHPGSVGVEVNFEIIPRTRYSGTLLKEGDSIEIVQFVGGG
jgi:sulfur carrier protein